MSPGIERTFTHMLIVLCNLTVVLWDLTPIWYLSEIWSSHTIMLTVCYMTILPPCFHVRCYQAVCHTISTHSSYKSHFYLVPLTHFSRFQWHKQKLMVSQNVPYLPSGFWHNGEAWMGNVIFRVGCCHERSWRGRKFCF